MIKSQEKVVKKFELHGYDRGGLERRACTMCTAHTWSLYLTIVEYSDPTLVNF